jgi:hypothetical protein
LPKIQRRNSISDDSDLPTAVQTHPQDELTWQNKAALFQALKTAPSKSPANAGFVKKKPQRDPA